MALPLHRQSRIIGTAVTSSLPSRGQEFPSRVAKPRRTFIPVEERKAKATEAYNQYMGERIDDVPPVHPEQRLLGMSRGSLGKNPEELWPGLCSGFDEPKAFVRAYLEDYVVSSTREVPVLGPEEVRLEQTVTFVSSVIDRWRRLTAYADGHVLSKHRREDKENPEFWRLTCINYARKGLTGPVSEVSQWIKHTLASKLGLMKESDYVKVEATPDDILLIIQVLYLRAADIPAEPENRISTHANIIAMAVGGFRPGTVCGLQFEQIFMAIARDSNDPTKTRPVATIVLKRNKLRASECSDNDIVAFSVTEAPCPALCLLRLILARAIELNAFENEFRTVDELYNTPALEDGVNLSPLRWKNEKLKEAVFPASYETFGNIWRRCLLVLGARDIPRLYSLRVGAGSRLADLMPPSRRNFLMSHTSHTFERSYQTARMKDPLLTLAFGKERAGDDQTLFKNLQDLTAMRDPNAPIMLEEDDLRRIEERNDITFRRAQLAAARQDRDNGAITKARSKLTSRHRAVYDLLLAEKRVKYFEQADKARGRGAPLSRQAPVSRQQDPTAESATRIGRLLKDCVEGKGVWSATFMNLVLCYLTRRDAPEISKGTPAAKVDELKMFCCLLRDDCKRYSDRRSLTRHVKNEHKTSFATPFECPKCLRQDKPKVWITCGPQWSNHTEKEHGKHFAPYLTSSERVPPTKYPCFLCRRSTEGRWLRRHVKQVHFKDGTFDQPFPCPECRRTGKEEWMENDEEWFEHVTSVHHGGASTGRGKTHPRVKRKRDEGTEPYGERVNKYNRGVLHGSASIGPMETRAGSRRKQDEAETFTKPISKYDLGRVHKVVIIKVECEDTNINTIPSV